MDALDSREFQSRLERLDAVLQEADQFSDAHARAHIRETVQAVLDLHKAGIERILGHLDAAGEAGSGVRDALVSDQVISGLLLLHGLHPLELQARVLGALEQVRPYLRSHGGNVELVDLADGVVTLRLEGSCRGCPSSAMTMKQTVEEAILAHAPDCSRLGRRGSRERTNDDAGRPGTGCPAISLNPNGSDGHYEHRLA